MSPPGIKREEVAGGAGTEALQQEEVDPPPLWVH